MKLERILDKLGSEKLFCKIIDTITSKKSSTIKELEK
jgi:hypothetical protein